MKKIILYFCLAALVLSGCAKSPKAGVNDDAKRYFESWMQVYHPDAIRTDLGAYILDETPGTGASAGLPENYPYVRANYTIRLLNGTVQRTTSEALSKQVGTYETNAGKNPYYGPVILLRGASGQAAGVEESLAAMNVGGRRTVAIPGWLLGLDASSGAPILYSKAEDYLEKVSGYTPLIYDFELTDVIPDIQKWQIDSVGRYIAAQFPGKSVKDSVKLGFYYFRTGEPSSTEKFKNDSTIYINYIGRRLDGTVFDTSIADTAKFYGIYSASRTYGPCAIKWYSEDKDYTEITMTVSGSSSSSSLITGFSLGLDQMYPHEKGSAIFISNWGYGATGSSPSIPGYSPLRFDLEIVDKPAS